MWRLPKNSPDACRKIPFNKIEKFHVIEYIFILAHFFDKVCFWLLGKTAEIFIKIYQKYKKGCYMFHEPNVHSDNPTTNVP